MAFVHKIKVTYTAGSDAAFSNEVSITSEEQIEQDLVVPINSADYAVDFDAIVANIKSALIVSDKALTLKTNDVTTPDDTIVLAAGVPVAFGGGIGANPFTADVSSLHFVNAASSGAAANVKVRIGYDPTP